MDAKGGSPGPGSSGPSSPSTGPSSGGSPTDAPSTGAPSPAPSTSPRSPDFTPDPGRLPRTRAQALRLARNVAASPTSWGQGFARSAAYESEPGTKPVLDEDCVWQREPLRSTVLSSVSRRSELPAADGKGPLQVTAVVTVHRSVKDAEWEMAGTLEEALRCPDQRLSGSERITGLMSQGIVYGSQGNFTSEDSVNEEGEYHSEEFGGPHPYYWAQSRLGRVTVAAVGKGAEGRGEDEVTTAVIQGLTHMMTRAEAELEAR